MYPELHPSSSDLSISHQAFSLSVRISRRRRQHGWRSRQISSPQPEVISSTGSSSESCDVSHQARIYHNYVGKSQRSPTTGRKSYHTRKEEHRTCSKTCAIDILCMFNSSVAFTDLIIAMCDLLEPNLTFYAPWYRHHMNFSPNSSDPFENATPVERAATHGFCVLSLRKMIKLQARYWS